MLSLNARVLIAATAILVAFFGLAGITLDNAYRNSSENELIKRLEVQVYALIALAAIDEQGNVYIPDMVPDTSFLIFSPDTYARVTDPDGRIVWSSPTPVGINVPYKVKLSRNERYFSYAQITDNFSVGMYSMGIAWHDLAGKVYTFSVSESLEEFNNKAARYRRNLWGLLGGVGLLLIVVQGAIMRWGLSPLNRAAGELVAIESGRKTHLSSDYPKELKGLTENVNALLAHQHEHLERYRHTLGDLAHSLKTPLAVMQSTLDDLQLAGNPTETIQEQVDRMVQITEYQLQRAATAGQSPLIAPVDVKEMLGKVIKSLQKVYAEKSVRFEKIISDKIVFHGDEGDLMEIIGNLSDNAFKYCEQHVRVTIKMDKHSKKPAIGVLMIFEDDGAGIPDKFVKHVIQRGVRVDQGISGHGIGLSVVQDIVQIYGGELNFGASELGGAEVCVWLPEST